MRTPPSSRPSAASNHGSRRAIVKMTPATALFDVVTRRA
jgi:hypothetical protein